MRYEKGASQPSAVGPALYHQYALNDLFDIDVTGTGHQPALYDTMKVIWTRNRVRKAHIKYTMQNSTTVPLRVFFILSTENETPPDGGTVDYKNAVGYIGHMDLARSDSGGSQRTFKKSVNVDYWVSKMVYSNLGQPDSSLGSMWANADASPGRPLYLYVIATNFDLDDTTTSIAYSYIADFTLDTDWATPADDLFEDED